MALVACTPSITTEHSYLPEKTVALEKWERHLEGQEPAKVVNITARRRRTA